MSRRGKFMTWGHAAQSKVKPLRYGSIMIMADQAHCRVVELWDVCLTYGFAACSFGSRVSLANLPRIRAASACTN